MSEIINLHKEWRPISSAPRDGSMVEITALENGVPFEIWPLRWDVEMVNGLFPGVEGMWTTPDKSMTWVHGTPEEGGPTHWRPLSTHNPEKEE